MLGMGRVARGRSQMRQRSRSRSSPLVTRAVDHRGRGAIAFELVDHLDPDLAAAIRAVPAWDLAEPSVTPIEAGITNRNFRVGVDGELLVVRLAGADTELLRIDREAEVAAARAAAETGVGPQVIAWLPDHGCLVTRFVATASPRPTFSARMSSQRPCAR